MAKIAFGVITNNIDTFYPYCDFILNAQKNGHEITKMFICYSHRLNRRKLKAMQKHVDIELLKINNNEKLKKQLLDLGLTKYEVEKLIQSQDLKKYGLVPYGKRRNIVLLAALLSKPKIDYLMFFDTDVKPYVLADNEGNKREIDFVGNHLKYLQKENVVVTTSDYTGYYIIPSMYFDGLKELLEGLQKEKAYEFVKSEGHNLITESKNNILKAKSTNKILGGNHAIDLNKYELLAPYYSTTYHYRQDLVLGRGEDTLLGQVIPDLGGKIIDIETKIFHNTFDSYPEVPNIHNTDVRERFYCACLGWLGRNPFLNWYLKNKGEWAPDKFDDDIEKLRKKLVKGSYKFADNYNSPKFKDLPEAFSVAYSQLDHMVEDYEQLMDIWNKIIEGLKQRR
ncbi:MAG TPA: hypothetical protein VJ907_02385 [Halanaerobiales bacterium]|nr:hypothetical protein [Halanaerobiales bacterium]